MRILLSIGPVLLVLLIGHSVRAQAPSDPAKQAVWVEALGPALGYTANYEYRVSRSLSVRGGAGYTYYSIGSTRWDGLTTIGSVSYFPLKSQRHHLELGGSLAYILVPDSDNDTAIVGGLIGYRFQPPDGGPVLRVFFSPVYLVARSNFFPAMVGASAGWSF
jgi:hypothetical protein